MGSYEKLWDLMCNHYLMGFPTKNFKRDGYYYQHRLQRDELDSLLLAVSQAGPLFYENSTGIQICLPITLCKGKPNRVIFCMISTRGRPDITYTFEVGEGIQGSDDH